MRWGTCAPFVHPGKSIVGQTPTILSPGPEKITVKLTAALMESLRIPLSTLNHRLPPILRYNWGAVCVENLSAIEEDLPQSWKAREGAATLLLPGDVVHIGWLQAVLLGLLQGLTEFLPVSSTAHMAI